MATKLVSKDKLKFQGGYFYKGNKRVWIETTVVNQLNELETMMQKFKYLEKQGDYRPMPSLDGFKREHIGTVDISIKAATPILDREIEKTKKMLEEIDEHNVSVEAENVAKDFQQLIRWADSEEIVVSTNEAIFDMICDTPHFNPLELTVDQVINVITYMVSDGKFGGVDVSDKTLEA